MHQDTTLASGLKGTGSGKTKVMKFSMTWLLVYKRESLGTECVGITTTQERQDKAQAQIQNG